MSTWKTDKGTLRLSRLDELLFTVLSDAWLTPVATFAHKSEAGVELRQWLSCTGFFSWRSGCLNGRGMAPACWSYT